MSNDVEKRIQQFRNMALSDPHNELGHFSLGKALVEAERFGEAIESLSRAIELNPSLSKAYQFLGEAASKAGDRTKAVEVLERGVQVADEQGDRMPRDAMIQLLKEMGATVPSVGGAKAKETQVKAGGESSTGFRCARCSGPSGQLEKPPFKGVLGAKIGANICKACWREWIGMGTKVINELGLQLNTPDAQATYDQYMIEFLQLEDR
ncbi:MAG: Fe(2+)-trafficking protein [Planctomycetota bacterium]